MQSPPTQGRTPCPATRAELWTQRQGAAGRWRRSGRRPYSSPGCEGTESADSRTGLRIRGSRWRGRNVQAGPEPMPRMLRPRPPCELGLVAFEEHSMVPLDRFLADEGMCRPLQLQPLAEHTLRVAPSGFIGVHISPGAKLLEKIRVGQRR